MSELYLGNQLITPVIMETVIGEGVSNYNDLDNKPTINDVELIGNKTASDLGLATPTDIMQAIASIPQFKLSIVDELPSAGEKMTLYLVPKEGTNNDVYNEYIWIEQTTSYEHLGTTAVDLTDYVKNTDYGTTSKGGVVKANTTYCFSINGNNGIPTCVAIKNLDSYKSRYNEMFVSKGTLETIKNDYVKRAVTENDIELTDDEKTSACNWLGTAKTVLTTEADYNALETKDSNTLYLIEE